MLNKSVLPAEVFEIFPENYQKYLKVQTLKAGQAICHQGDELTALSYIISGKVKIVRRLFNGREHILDIKSQPTLIGDVELLTDQKNVSSVIALDETVVVQLPLALIKDDLLADATALLRLGRGLAQALYDQNIRASTNLTYTVKERLATHILEVALDGRFRPELSSLADSFGVSYRHLTRVLHQMVQEGILEKRKPFYHILDEKALLLLQITD